MTCHSCDTVVEDDGQVAAAVVYSIHQRIDTCVEECGVSDYADYLGLLAGILECYGSAVSL